MASPKLISVEVAYARADGQKIIKVEVSEGSSVEVAIDRSGITELFPEIDLIKQKVGVFGEVRALTDVLREGDRVEIYRELLVDPKDARRKRAKKT